MLGRRRIARLDDWRRHARQDGVVDDLWRVERQQIGDGGEVGGPCLVRRIAEAIQRVFGGLRIAQRHLRQRQPLRRRRRRLFLERAAEPVLRRFELVAAIEIPSEQQAILGVFGAARLVGQPRQVILRHHRLGIGSAARDQRAGDAGTDGVEFRLAVRPRLLQPHQRVEMRDIENQAGLLDGGEALLRIVAVLEDIAIGVAGPVLPVGAGKGLADAPEDIHLAAGQQLRRFGRQFDNPVVLMRIGGLHQLAASRRQPQAFHELVRRRPVRLGFLPLGNRLGDVVIAAFGVKFPHGVKLWIAAGGDRQRVGRRLPAGVERAQARNFRLQAHRVAARGKVA